MAVGFSFIVLFIFIEKCRVAPGALGQEHSATNIITAFKPTSLYDKRLTCLIWRVYCYWACAEYIESQRDVEPQWALKEVLVIFFRLPLVTLERIVWREIDATRTNASDVKCLEWIEIEVCKEIIIYVLNLVSSVKALSIITVMIIKFFLENKDGKFYFN